MKKNLLTIILTILLLLIIILNFVSKPNFSNILSHENKNNTVINNKVVIYTYPKSSDDILKNEIKIENTRYLDKIDYINLVLQNSEYINKTMEVLAVYELEDKNLIIKLNENFKKLSNDDYNKLVKSINATLKNVFYDINKIIIQID